jgi:preprotein translocase subunit SecE
VVTKKATATRGIGSRFQFITNIIVELKKVTWPSRQEAIRLTIMVLIVCIVAGIFLGLADFGFTNLVEYAFMP